MFFNPNDPAVVILSFQVDASCWGIASPIPEVQHTRCYAQMLTVGTMELRRKALRGTVVSPRIENELLSLKIRIWNHDLLTKRRAEGFRFSAVKQELRIGNCKTVGQRGQCCATSIYEPQIFSSATWTFWRNFRPRPTQAVAPTRTLQK